MRLRTDIAVGVSLCTGTGALDLALERHLGVDVTVFAEIDPLAARVVGRHWPDAHNLGDISTIDWSGVEYPTDWLVAGYPCQPFSLAGRREGTADPRHVWPHIVEAVRVLRPRRILLENVAGHRSQGFGDVLGDLAACGYDARWCSVRACDVGAPHRRERVFVVAHPSDHRRDGGSGTPRGRSPRPAHSDQRADRRPAADAADRARAQGRQSAPGQAPRREPAQRDAGRRGREGAAADADRERLRLQSLAQSRSGDPPEPGAGDDWGRYQPAIRRWEKVLGRPAPPATVRGARGAQRLSADFVEWMMGLPEGWVTRVRASSKEHLRLLGNGVVPAQAQCALQLLAVQ